VLTAAYVKSLSISLLLETYEMDPQLTQADEIVKAFALPLTAAAKQKLYVLMRPGAPVAFYTQQCRALNLVWALAQRNGKADVLGAVEDRPGEGLKGKRVVVVGAGAAGLTAAAGAALAGAHVRILEKAERPMSLQIGCDHRFLHPRFHYWPRKRSQSAAAALPLLTWSVGTAGQVADTIVDQFHQINDWLALSEAAKGGFHRIELVYNVRGIEEPKNVDAECYVGYNGAEKETCHDLIFAVGFGVERTVKGLAPRSYWRSDPLTQPSIGHSGKKRRVLVAGDGDAGSIDVLRAALNGFDHGPFIDRIIEMTMGDARLHDGIKKAETAVGTHLNKMKREFGADYSKRSGEVRAEASRVLDEEYRKLLGQGIKSLEALQKYLKPLARSDVEVTWIGQLPSPASLETYTLNRLLVWLVCELQLVKYRPHRSLRRVDPKDISPAGAWLGCSAHIQQIELVDGRYKDANLKEEIEFDEVIVCYGGIRPLLSEFGPWGADLYKRWQESDKGGAWQKVGEPREGVAAFFTNKLDILKKAVQAEPLPMVMKASYLDEVEGRTLEIDGDKWPLFRIKLSIHPPEPIPSDKTEAKKNGLRDDDWVEYHLHPYRKGIRRRANRGPDGAFSLVVFTRDDYWVDASFKGGRRLAGGWLSGLLAPQELQCGPVRVAKLKDCAHKLWKGAYDPEKPPPLVLLDVELKFERKLERAPDDQSAKPET
jgi:hypothetical protein